MSRALKRHTENTSPRPQTLTGPCPAVHFDRAEISQFSKLSSARLVVAKVERGRGEGMDWEFEVSRCKLSHIEWMNDKSLLYATGNYIQHPVINHNGKEHKKYYIYMFN